MYTCISVNKNEKTVSIYDDSDNTVQSISTGDAIKLINKGVDIVNLGVSSLGFIYAPSDIELSYNKIISACYTSNIEVFIDAIFTDIKPLVSMIYTYSKSRIPEYPAIVQSGHSYYAKILFKFIHGKKLVGDKLVPEYSKEALEKNFTAIFTDLLHQMHISFSNVEVTVRG